MSTDILISPLDLELEEGETEYRRELEELARRVFTKGISPDNQVSNINQEVGK